MYKIFIFSIPGVAKLIVALLSTNNLDLNRKLKEENTLDALLDLFFKYSLNNFLHSQVEQCVQVWEKVVLFYVQKIKVRVNFQLVFEWRPPPPKPVSTSEPSSSSAAASSAIQQEDNAAAADGAAGAAAASGSEAASSSTPPTLPSSPKDGDNGDEVCHFPRFILKKKKGIYCTIGWISHNSVPKTGLFQIQTERCPHFILKI